MCVGVGLCVWVSVIEGDECVWVSGIEGDECVWVWDCVCG